MVVASCGSDAEEASTDTTEVTADNASTESSGGGSSGDDASDTSVSTGSVDIGKFITELAEIYGDDNWRMYDEDGNVFVTETAEESSWPLGQTLTPRFRITVWKACWSGSRTVSRSQPRSPSRSIPCSLILRPVSLESASHSTAFGNECEKFGVSNVAGRDDQQP